MLHKIESTNLVLTDTPLPFMQGNVREVERYWNSVMHGSDRLWNGAFYMFTNVHVKDGVLHGTGHKTDFATFLYWRDNWRANGRDGGIQHITGTTFPHFVDGALLAIKMAEHTANPGRVYYPAGSFDEGDIINNCFDVATNVRREFKEEIGLDVESDWMSSTHLVVESNQSFHVCQAMRLPMSFEQLEKDWKNHRANGGDDEISDLIKVSSVNDIPASMKSYARTLARYHFENISEKAVIS